MAKRPLLDPITPPQMPESHLVTARPSAELRIERSRFSRLLARFGLGELTDPILRPTNRAAGRGHTG
jgi:hypothetical protein